MILKEMATTVTPNPGHQQTHSVQHHPHQQAGGSSGHYCKDCGVMFESSTSLEVHLSYHKENLLTRWANQESMEKSNHRAGAQDIPPPHTENGGSNYFPSQGEVQQGHFVPPQYNNNTGDHHVEPPMSYRNAFHPTPPVDPHGGSHHLYGIPHGSHIFSPGSRNANRPGNGANPAESPAEILDLDSHKVHIYQQQQAAERANANFFHRPYLPHLLPPPLLQLQNPTGNNGWHAPPDFVPPTPNGPGFPGDHHPSYPNSLPPPNGSNIVYDIVRPDSGNYPPQETSGQQPPGHHSFAPEQFNGIRGVYDSDEAPARPSPRPNVKSPKRSPAAPKGSNATPGKGKGWKGGECKRPKTYNCQACNKWFTSSGHLKRHYGTTLHKNSIRQKGEMVEEMPSKPGKRSPPESKKSIGGGSGGNGTDSMDSSEPTSSPPLRDSGNKSEESISGKSTPIYMPPSGSRESNFLPQPGHPARSPNNGPSFVMGLPGGQPYHPPISSAYGSNTPPTSGIAQQYIQAHHIQQPPSGQQQQQFHHFQVSTHSPHPFSNGFPPEGMGNSSPFTSASAIPTTVYSSGPYSMEGSSLPPFSTVGFSHYDPNTFHGPPGGTSNFPANGPPQSNFGSNGREEQRSSPSSQVFDRPYESVKVEQDSPEEARSGSVSHSLAGSFFEDETEMSGTVSGSSEGEGSPNYPDSVGDSILEEGRREVYQCPTCSKTFGRPCYLTQHTNSSHAGTKKPFKCQMCGKKFPEAPALSDHVAKHGSDDKPYKCDLCPKQFNHKTDLRRHLCLHTGEKPYLCKDCGRGFIRKDHMAKHRATHKKKSTV